LQLCVISPSVCLMATSSRASAVDSFTSFNATGIIPHFSLLDWILVLSFNKYTAVSVFMFQQFSSGPRSHSSAAGHRCGGTSPNPFLVINRLLFPHILSSTPRDCVCVRMRAGDLQEAVLSSVELVKLLCLTSLLTSLDDNSSTSSSSAITAAALSST